MKISSYYSCKENPTNSGYVIYILVYLYTQHILLPDSDAILKHKVEQICKEKPSLEKLLRVFHRQYRPVLQSSYIIKAINYLSRIERESLKETSTLTKFTEEETGAPIHWSWLPKDLRIRINATIKARISGLQVSWSFQDSKEKTLKSL